ncbi:MAG: hypothetical protein Q8R39_02160 [bacterium]|nr:hypothetical protein [bacterium]MDZ4284200.1 hypothetical protein [Patescibacteria group bacterium]
MLDIPVVVSGSFRKHLAEIQEAIRQFRALGVTVLSPQLSPAVNPGDDFVLLESDDTDDPSVLEQRHLDAIAEAHLLYICNPGGYIGPTVAMEIGWARAHEVPIVASHTLADVTLMHFVDQTLLSPKEVVAAFLRYRSGTS